MNEEMDQKDFLIAAIMRLRFKNSWTKEELCRHLDVNMADLHKYLNGKEKPTESLLLIIQSELEGGGYERRVKLRMNEIVDRIIDMDHRLNLMEKKIDDLISRLKDKKE